MLVLQLKLLKSASINFTLQCHLHHEPNPEMFSSQWVASSSEGAQSEQSTMHVVSNMKVLIPLPFMLNSQPSKCWWSQSNETSRSTSLTKNRFAIPRPPTVAISVGWQRLENLSIKMTNRINENALAESNTHWEHAWLTSENNKHSSHSQQFSKGSIRLHNSAKTLYSCAVGQTDWSSYSILCTVSAAAECCCNTHLGVAASEVSLSYVS